MAGQPPARPWTSLCQITNTVQNKTRGKQLMANTETIETSLAETKEQKEMHQHVSHDCLWEQWDKSLFLSCPFKFFLYSQIFY